MSYTLLTTEDEISDTVDIRWKIGPTHPKSKCLLLRLATKSKWQGHSFVTLAGLSIHVEEYRRAEKFTLGG